MVCAIHIGPEKCKIEDTNYNIARALFSFKPALEISDALAYSAFNKQTNSEKYLSDNPHDRSDGFN